MDQPTAEPALKKLEPLVGPTFPLNDVNEAVNASLAGSPGRVLVLP